MTLSLVGASLVLACGDDPGPRPGVADDGGLQGSSTGGPDALESSTGALTTGISAADEGSSTARGTSEADEGNDTLRFDLAAPGESSGEDCGSIETNLTLRGTVFGPDGELPVSGALVYVAETRPSGIPQQVYCEECVTLGCEAHSTLSAPDGRFTIHAVAGEANYLVVQKGQFMRVSPISYASGTTTTLSSNLTSLPDHNDPNGGQYIPLIAVANGAYDRLEDALGKFGLGETVIGGFEERLVPGSASFDLWDNGRAPGTDGHASQGTFGQLVSDPVRLADYHIIFVPCSVDTYSDALTVQQVQNIRNWVEAGGRWYVADWSNEWLVDVFPEYQTLNCPGGDCDNGSYDSLANVLDPGLLAWLEAVPPAFQDINPFNDESHPTLGQLPLLQTVDNWSSIVSINPVLVNDGSGNQIDVGHKVWLEGPGGIGPVHPLTVTGQFGCGKIQFTSYHAAEFFNYVGLSPQELVLIYTILEIGECQEPLPPPQG